ncbi:hypothetical protein GQ457_03G036360 [Hibiscus cannabinus]
MMGWSRKLSSSHLTQRSNAARFISSTPQKSSSTTMDKKCQNTTASDSQHRQSRSMSHAKSNNMVSVENLSTTDRRRGRVRVWIPHLKSISETPNDDD